MLDDPREGLMADKLLRQRKRLVSYNVESTAPPTITIIPTTTPVHFNLIPAGGDTYLCQPY